MARCVRKTIPPMSARAFQVPSGATLRIVDTEGGQPGDFVAFREDDHSVRFSQARSRVELGRVWAGEGDTLWTDTMPPEAMFEITQDTYGGHDLLYTPCCRYALAKRFGVSRDGCLEHLAASLSSWGIVLGEIPAPLNLFFRVAVDSTGAMRVSEPDSLARSVLQMQARMDCLVAVSTCSVPFAGRMPSGYDIEILGA